MRPFNVPAFLQLDTLLSLARPLVHVHSSLMKTPVGQTVRVNGGWKVTDCAAHFFLPGEEAPLALVPTGRWEDEGVLGFQSGRLMNFPPVLR